MIQKILDKNGVSFERNGFCAAIAEKNSTARLDSDNVEEFVEFVKDKHLSWVDFVVKNFEQEAENVATKLGFSEPLLKNLLKNTRSSYEDLGTEMGLIIPAILARGFDVTMSPLLILIKENLIVSIHTTEVKRFFRLRKYAETFIRKLPAKANRSDKLTLILIRVIDENNSRNFEHLQEIESVGDKINLQLVDQKTPREQVGKEIYEMKHALIFYLNGMWSIIDTLNSLRYGDADLITDDQKILVRINVLINEVNVHIALTEHMSEVLASGLEVVQAIYNNQLQILNNRLAMLVSILTIVGTALLVPNTIATVASNSMFEFTKADIPWYLGLMFASTIAATIIAWWAVVKMGFLPKSPE
ncbi:MAG: magnesium transporter CorA [Candidatus Diapherotrites archaeon]|nr:magnesium transporter CorA [Candidatus Diapherotrites archaeon]